MAVTRYRTFSEYLEHSKGAAALADHLRKLLVGLGDDVDHQVMRSQETFGVDRKFAQFTSTRMYGTNFPDDWILLTFTTADAIDSARLGVIEEGTSKTRHTYRIELHGKSDVDAQLRGWLERAYAFGRREP